MPQRRKPAEEQELRGNPGRRPLTIAPLDELPALDVMPAVELSADARTVWAMLAPALINLKILRQTDALTFGIFCESFARYARALAAIRKEGDVQTVKTVSGDKMRRLNPRIKVLKDERDVVLRYAEKFGLTPVDRFRVIQHLTGGALPPPSSNPGALPADGDLLDVRAEPLSDAGPLTDPVGALG